MTEVLCSRRVEAWAEDRQGSCGWVASSPSRFTRRGGLGSKESMDAVAVAAAVAPDERALVGRHARYLGSGSTISTAHSRSRALRGGLAPQIIDQAVRGDNLVVAPRSPSANSRRSTEMTVAAHAHLPPPEARAFRDALGRFATGVAFITAAPGGQPAGLIVNSLSSVSLEPPLVSFSPARSSLTWSRMRRAGRFGVNVLGRQHEPFVVRAAPAGADRFADLDWKPARSGVPLLTDALVRLECEIVAEHLAGDHSIVVGQVSNLDISPRSDPLVFFAGEFASLKQPSRPSSRHPDTAVLSPIPRAPKRQPSVGRHEQRGRSNH
jgi:3-hydroxy-9,10-secoandrosta-1,3,5(10)-triene-9,17-dione monooxygenase reductase component